MSAYGLVFSSVRTKHSSYKSHQTSIITIRKQSFNIQVFQLFQWFQAFVFGSNSQFHVSGWMNFEIKVKFVSLLDISQSHSTFTIILTLTKSSQTRPLVHFRFDFTKHVTSSKVVQTMKQAKIKGKNRMERREEKAMWWEERVVVKLSHH